jgi:hypothetical protein
MGSSPTTKAPFSCIVISLFSVIIQGCDSSESVPAAFTTRDSAGVIIAENAGALPEGSGGWVISPEPEVQIGAIEGDDAYLLFRAWGATRLSDGRIAVANNRAPDIRVFGPGGEHQHTFGQRGEGPQDFDSPVLMGKLPGDTLVVVDRILRRVNLYHPDEGFVRGATADPAIAGYLLVEGMFGSGAPLVWTSEWDVDMPNGLYRFPLNYTSVGLDGSIETEFGSFPGDETVYASRETERGTSVMSSGPPFGKSAVAAVSGDNFFYGSQDRYEIQVLDQSGELRRIIRRDKSPVPVTDAHVEAVMAEMVDRADDNDQAREFRRMFREAPISELHPAHGALYADRLGFLWVEEYRLPGEEARLTTIFDPEGRMVESLVLPQGLRIEEIGVDYILGLYRDELGVEYVRSYRLTRAR